MAAVAVNGLKLGTTSQAYLESKPVSDTKVLISDLCRQFYNLGWVSGTGGSITIKVHDDSVPKPEQLVIMSPSGVQKERMLPEDMYVLSPNGAVVSSPSPKPYPHKPPKCSDCGPLFMKNVGKRRLILRQKRSRNANYKVQCNTIREVDDFGYEVQENPSELCWL